MDIIFDTIVSMSEAQQNFPKVAKLVDEKGAVVIEENNAPTYVVMEYKRVKKESFASDAAILNISKHIIDKNREAYGELAK